VKQNYKSKGNSSIIIIIFIVIVINMCYRTAVDILVNLKVTAVKQ